MSAARARRGCKCVRQARASTETRRQHEALAAHLPMRTWHVVAALALFGCVADARRSKGGQVLSKGAPPDRLVEQKMFSSTKKRKAQFEANGFRWPQKAKFKGWPPVRNGSFTPEYLESRQQLSSFFKKLPLSSHHKVQAWDHFAATLFLPRFSELGFAVKDAAGPLRKTWRKIRAIYKKNRSTAPREKWFSVPQGYEDLRPRFIDTSELQRLNQLVMEQLRPLAEEWSGVKRLNPANVYGIRVYQNGSTLNYHTDTPDTHIVSAIFHIDHDTDEPWPIEIEDHNTGEIHAVSLEPGQYMFYESATAFHGRLTPMRGRDYGSIFVHYTPEDWTWKTTHLNAAIPYDVDFSVIEPPQSAAWIPPEVEKQLTGKTTSRSVENDERYGANGKKTAKKPIPWSEDLPPIEKYRRNYYRDRGLDLLDFYGEPHHADGPVQNAAHMYVSIPHAEL